MKKLCVLGLVVGLGIGSTYAAGLPLSDQTAAFKAAGFKKKGKVWISCAVGNIEEAMDLNGDGLPEIVIIEDNFACYGNAAQAFSVVTKQANGRWRLVAQQIGIPDFLWRTKKSGWPDLQIGGPGFCFPVLRWNGQKYIFHRHEYEGKVCHIDQ